MIIKTQEDVTKAVLSEIQHTPNERLREILSAFVRFQNRKNLFTGQ